MGRVAMSPDSKSLPPPFSKDNCVLPASSPLPPTFRKDNRIYTTTSHIHDYLESDLLTPKINRVHRHLWLAGLPRPARPLHRQKLLGRDIYPTESPNEHLVWHGSRIFIKPLPEYLLDYNFWVVELGTVEVLYRSACGLLVSYVWLVSCKNDLRIAQEIGLLPEAVEWDDWVSFVLDVLNHLDVHTLYQVDRRYLYGELRLTRLNSLYRFGAAGFSPFNLVHGFMMGSERYDTFFQRNFGWILALLLYVTVVLSAVQVALDTDRLGTDIHFQVFSYGISVLSLGLVAGAVGIMLVVWLGLFLFHLLSTRRYCGRAALQRQETLP